MLASNQNPLDVDRNQNCKIAKSNQAILTTRRVSFFEYFRNILFCFGAKFFPL